MFRAANDDRSAFGTLMERWELPVKRFHGRMVQNAAEAEDLTQQTFVNAWQHRTSFQPAAEFRPWLMAFAVGAARKRLRWWRRQPAISLEAWIEAGGDNESAEAPSEGEIVVRERAQAVRLAVAELPCALREIAVLFELEGLPQAEIVAILGCDRKAFEGRLFRARTALRVSLADVE